MTTTTSAAGTVNPKPKRGRGRPQPKLQSILNRDALLKALDAADITVSKSHLDGFYQALHREHYPELSDFVERYYKNDLDAKQLNAKKNGNSNGGQGSSNTPAEAAAAANPQDDRPAHRIPLKNPVSTRKNKNRVSLPKKLLDFLKDPNNGFVTVSSKVAKVKTSADQSTTKLAVQLHDGQLVESVLMRYGPKTDRTTGQLRKAGRASLCVSSQVGCAMGCNFCATGMMGLTGSLHYAEILEQVVHAERILAHEALERMAQTQEELEKGTSQRKINRKKQGLASDLEVVRNIVFMGMGEPLDNYTNVVTACRALVDRKRWNLAHWRVTVSTVGIASKIRQLTRDLPEICLALSLHAPNQALRSEIVPTAKHYPIEDMIDALDGHMRTVDKSRVNDGKPHHQADRTALLAHSTKRRAMIEYVMLEGKTSTLECAHELGKLCEGKALVVNLIPYNQTDVKDKLRCPSLAHIKEFQHIVLSYGVFCTIRRTMGADIDSACGQLITLENDRDEKEAPQVVRDIEDGMTGDSSASVIKKRMAKKATSSSRQKLSTASSASDTWTGAESSTDDQVDFFMDLEYWIRPLQIATTVAGAAFAVTSALYLRQQMKR